MNALDPRNETSAPKQFDVVTLLRVPQLDAEAFLKTNRRLPRIGDVATILEIYTQPPRRCLAYGLECCDLGSHETEWDHEFDADELCSYFGQYVPESRN